MINSIYSNMNDSIIRRITSKVELYNGSTLLHTYKKDDNLQSVEITRQGTKGKFFGFGVCQQATVIIIDKNREFNIEKGQKLKTYFSSDTEANYLKVGPTFTVSSVTRDETKNTVKIVAYDSINDATSHSVSELGLIPPYTIKRVVEQITSLLGLSVNITDNDFNLSYTEGANFEGNETLREVLDAAAEVTQTIYYINHNEELIFKTLDKSGNAVHLIEKSAYFQLQIKDSITLSNICQATELGNNVIAGDNSGATQYVRENPFWNNRDDLTTLLATATNKISGLTITQFNISWRGNFLLEIGDKIGIRAKDNSYVNTFVLNDVIKYSGGLSETTDWEYSSEEDRASINNPITLGDKISQTFAKVNKATREINLVAQDVTETKSELAELKLTTNDISLRVEAVENKDFDVDISEDENFIELSERVGQLEVTDKNIIASISNTETAVKKYTDEAIADVDGELTDLEDTLREEIQTGDEALSGELTTVKQDVSTLQVGSSEINATVKSLTSTTTDSINSLNNTVSALSKEVNLKVDSEAVTISIEKALEEGVSKVKTSSKNYTFDDKGLNIKSSDSEFNTTVDENGMRIYKNTTEVLTANNQGVVATDLHARTFLIIGENSRLEDRGRRTACFWIGSAEE